MVTVGYNSSSGKALWGTGGKLCIGCCGIYEESTPCDACLDFSVPKYIAANIEFSHGDYPGICNYCGVWAKPPAYTTYYGTFYKIEINNITLNKVPFTHRCVPAGYDYACYWDAQLAIPFGTVTKYVIPYEYPIAAKTCDAAAASPHVSTTIFTMTELQSSIVLNAPGYLNKIAISQRLSSSDRLLYYDYSATYPMVYDSEERYRCIMPGEATWTLPDEYNCIDGEYSVTTTVTEDFISVYPDWILRQAYYAEASDCVPCKVWHDAVLYLCIGNHTASSTNEPGVGASWETYWEVT